jgi:hypothetical protein
LCGRNTDADANPDGFADSNADTDGNTNGNTNSISQPHAYRGWADVH